MSRDHLERAKVAKNDEFYTDYGTISDEVPHYAPHFKGKSVYCNCDCFKKSNFVKYFSDNFEKLGLKSLVSTNYSPVVPPMLAGDGACPRGPAMYYEKRPGRPGIARPLAGDGSFSSPECMDILSKSDIVVTNPPFSLFRKYMKRTIASGAGFLILGPLNSIKYNDVFYDMKADNIWCGHNMGASKFTTPGDTKGIGILWLTNIGEPVSKTMPKLTRRFEDGGYQRLAYKHQRHFLKSAFDDDGALNIDKVANMPKNYDGVMAVPITFVKYWDRRRYKLIGITRGHSYVGEKQVFARLLIQEKGAFHKKNRDLMGCFEK